MLCKPDYQHSRLVGLKGVGVGDGLTLGGVADLAVTILNKAYHRGGSAVALAVSDDYRFVTFHDGNTAVGGSQVDSNDFSHVIIVILFLLILFRASSWSLFNDSDINYNAKSSQTAKTDILSATKDNIGQ